MVTFPPRELGKLVLFFFFFADSISLALVELVCTALGEKVVGAPPFNPLSLFGSPEGGLSELTDKVSRFGSRCFSPPPEE